MRTQALIDGLSRDLEPIRPGSIRGRVLVTALAGALVALALTLLWLGARTDLGEALAGRSYWLKALFTASIAASAIMTVLRAGRPGARLGEAAAWVAAPFVLAAGLGAAEWLTAVEADRASLLLGETWRFCSMRIALLSAPVLVVSLWAMREAAATRPALAGAAAGLLSGGVAATVYGLHCPETTAAFTATWYSLGMLAPAIVGAAVGRSVLRW